MKRPAGLYIHIPFCKNKCPYCDFVSGPASQKVKAQYMRALKKELQNWSFQGEVKDLLFQSLYVGGGTPTAVEPDLLAQVLSKAFKIFNWMDEPEVTVEANPESVRRKGLEILKRAGVNRISLGVQSMSKRGLKALGRLHDVAASIKAIEIVKDLGFDSLSVDLIYGWPGQEISGWKKELESVISFGPDHISCYELTVEKGTPLDKAVSASQVTLPDEDVVLEMMDITEEKLKAAGYVQYEISNYALPGKECVHNLGYWTARPYVGVGVSAASFLPPMRMKQIDHVREYVKNMEIYNIVPAFREILGKEHLFREAVVFGLRKSAGLDICQMKQAWGYDLVEYYGDLLKRLMDSGLLEFGSDQERVIKLTKRGRRISNLVFAELI